MATLDIRWPLGSIFTLIGAILAAYGAFADSPLPGADAINLAWGAILMGFGAAMLLMARRAALAQGGDR